MTFRFPYRLKPNRFAQFGSALLSVSMQINSATAAETTAGQPKENKGNAPVLKHANDATEYSHAPRYCEMILVSAKQY